jgi:HAD superfamily hydrolase (TIGR01509 family)
LEDLRAVLFDLDGVLVDSYEAWFKLVNAAARQFRAPDIDRERFQASWGQGIDADVKHFFPGQTIAAVTAFYEQHLLDHAAAIKVAPDAHEVLRALRDDQIPAGVVTNTPTFLARDILAWAGLIGLVEITVGAEPEVRAKPAPDCIERACRVLELPPEQVLVVGDSEFDAQAAQAARAQFQAFRPQSGRGLQHLRDVLPLVRRRD